MSIQRYAAPMQMLNLSSKWLGLKLETCQSNGKQALIWCNELSVRALAEIRTPTIALCFNFERRFPASGAAIFPMIQRRWLIRLGFHGEDPRTSAAHRTSGGCICSKSASGRDRIVSEVFTVVSLWRTAGFDVRWASAGCLCVNRGLSRHGIDLPGTLAEIGCSAAIWVNVHHLLRKEIAVNRARRYRGCVRKCRLRTQA